MAVSILERTTQTVTICHAFELLRKARQLVTDCHRFKVGDKLPPPYKKEALSGFLEVWVLLAEDVGDPEATDVVGQGLGGDQTKSVLFAHMTEFNRCTHIFVLVLFYFR